MSDMVTLMQECSKIEKNFLKILEKSGEYQVKGIFNSELLMFCGLLKLMGIEQVVESGRARGYSTQIIARFCGENDILFDSIEYDRTSEDVPIAEQNLADLTNFVTLHYGDAHNIMPKIIRKSKVALLIDGPKGMAAIALGAKMLEQANVQFCAFHDVHNDALPARSILNQFYEKNLFSDDKEFVDRFRSIDDSCWEQQAKSPEFSDWAPFKRGGRKMQSYSSTIGVISKRKSAVSYPMVLVSIRKAMREKQGWVRYFKYRLKNLILSS